MSIDIAAIALISVVEHSTIISALVSIIDRLTLLLLRASVLVDIAAIVITTRASSLIVLV